MYPYAGDTCDYSKYSDVWKNWLVNDNHTHTGKMTVVSCPLCDYETGDVYDTIAAVLLSTHAISHQPGTTASSAKVERVKRPVINFRQQEHPRTGTTSSQCGMITSRRPRLLGRTRSYGWSNVAMRNSIETSPVWPAVAPPTKQPKKPWRQ